VFLVYEKRFSLVDALLRAVSPALAAAYADVGDEEAFF